MRPQNSAGLVNGNDAVTSGYWLVNSNDMEPIQRKSNAGRLEKPVRITEQVWPEGTVPVVSIFCITYNHEKFIRDAIGGFLMQETTFPVEIFIHDDASSDGTAQIVKEYAARYPQLFWTVLQTENQWSKGNKKILWDYLARQRGEFIAMCEGDDYWISPHKLEKQVALLEENHAASGSFHVARVMDDQGNDAGADPPEVYQRDRNFEDACFSYWLPTCSLVFRRRCAPHDMAWASHLLMGDVPLIAELCHQGPLKFINEEMSVYRRHPGGAWSRCSQEKQIRSLIDLYEAIAKRFQDARLEPLQHSRKHMYVQLFGALVDKRAYVNAWKVLATYLFARPQGAGNLFETQKSNVLRLLTFGICPKKPVQ
jgi:glycosyltransferase involved in cell wall biosynthesis